MMVLNKNTPSAVALIGPTAVGKTGLSLRLAKHFSGEIISVDSMQIYRYMDIGTAKADPEERQKIPHHLLDIVDPDEDYNVACFIDDALKAAALIKKHGNTPFLVGGTGLYLKGLTEGLFDMDRADAGLRGSLQKEMQEKGRASLYMKLRECDPESAARIHPNDTQRLLRAMEVYQSTGLSWSRQLAEQKKGPPMPGVLKIGLIREREELYCRINKRVNRMMEAGLLNEVQKLLDIGYDCHLSAMQSIGYRHMCQYIAGTWGLDEALRLLSRDTRRYAKRQLTWFQRDPEIHWYSPDNEDEIFSLIELNLKKC